MHIYAANDRSQSFELYTRDLDKCLIHATKSAEKATIVYKEYQDAFLKCKKEFVLEWLEHWGSKEELQFKRERADKVDKCLDYAYDVL